MIRRFSDSYDLSELSLMIELQMEDWVDTSDGAVGVGHMEGNDSNELSDESLDAIEGSGSKAGLSVRLSCR